MHVPAKQGIVANYVSHVQIHLKSTANPSPRVRWLPLPLLFIQFLQLRCFDASLPRRSSPSPLSHPILPSDIPPCPGVSPRDHDHSPLLPTPSLPSISHAVTEPPATSCCQLPLTNPFITPLAILQPLQYPPPSSSQASLLSCSHPASALPYRPCFLPTHTTYTPAIPTCLLYHLPTPTDFSLIPLAAVVPPSSIVLAPARHAAVPED